MKIFLQVKAFFNKNQGLYTKEKSIVFVKLPLKDFMSSFREN
jgi:hypothetical protein